MADVDPLVLLTIASATAREAGALLLARRGLVHDVTTKTSDTDVVTEVDRDAESLIVSRILGLRPADAVLGEEGGGHPGTSGVRWVIDPLDGTVNYLYGRDEFAVSIAAEVDGVAVAGTVFAPATDEMFEAALGHGATLNGAPIRPTPETRLTHALVGSGFAYDAAARVTQGRVAARVIPRIRDLRRAGSAALDVCAVACGRLDAYYERGVHAWDIAAASLVVREAGGMAESLDGTPPGGTTVWIASNAGLAPEFRALVTEASSEP